MAQSIELAGRTAVDDGVCSELVTLLYPSVLLSYRF